MKRMTIFILILFFITGCEERNLDYELTIFPDKIEEKAFLAMKDNDYEIANYLNDVFLISMITYDNEEESGKAIIDEIKNENFSPSYISNDYFQKTIDGDKIVFSYAHVNDEYAKSTIFTSCFKNSYYDSTDNYYTIKGYDQFKCLFKDEIKVVIRTDYKVIDSNADKVKNNQYIWYFNEKNYMDHELYIQVSKTQMINRNSYWKLYILIGFIVIYIFYKLVNKRIVFSFIKNNDI